MANIEFVNMHLDRFIGVIYFLILGSKMPSSKINSMARICQESQNYPGVVCFTIQVRKRRQSLCISNVELLH